MVRKSLCALMCLMTAFFVALPGVVGSPISAFAAEPSLDWPQWRGPQRDNRSSFRGLNTNWEAHPPELLWKLSGVGQGYASVSIQNGKLFTTGNLDNGQNVFAIDLKTQKIVWQTPITSGPPKHGYDGSRCTPTLDGDQLFVVSSDGGIACLATATGKVIWQRSFNDWGGKMMSGWGFSESPLLDGEHVLCTPGGPEAMMVCLQKETGDEVWRCKLNGEGREGAGYSSIVISEAAGVKQYIQLVGRGLIGVRASNGEHLWTYDRIANGVANIPTPIPNGDYVFGSTGYNEGGSALLRLRPAGNVVKTEEIYYYSSKELQNHHGGMVLDGKHLYFGHGHNKGFPVCVDFLSGKIVWEARKESRDLGSDSAAITWVDGHLIFRYQSGQIALVEASPKGFAAKGVFKPEIVEREGWSQPVVVDGKLYLREQNHLMCYDISATN
jgi:outer membrane protein assembly factor BamB